MFDSIVFIAILIFMWKGYKRGFERELPRLASVVAAIVIGIIFYSAIGAILSATPLPDFIGGFTSESFIRRISSKEIENGTVNQIFGAITHEENKTQIIGEFVVKFIAFLLVFAAAYFVLRYVFKKTKVFKKVKVVRQMRHALGGVLGIVRGILYAYLAVALLVICEPMISTNFVRNGVERSEIVRFMYEDNYIANIVAQHEYLTSGE